MKRLQILIGLFVLFIPFLQAEETGMPTSSLFIQLPSLSSWQFYTLEVIDVNGNEVKGITIQKTINQDRDDFLGLYVRLSDRLSYYVVRPVGGEPIKYISWKNDLGGRVYLNLNGRSVPEYYRDEQAKQDGNAAIQTVRASVDLMALIVEPLSKPDANSLYTKWSEKGGVTATYISKSMFKMIRSIPQLQLDRPIDLTPIIQTLDGLYMLEFAEQWQHSDGGSTSISLAQRYTRNTFGGGLRKDIQDYLFAKGYEKLREKREGEQYTRLYIAADRKTVTGFVLVRMDPGFNYGQFICIEGRIPRDQFEKIIADGMKE